MQVYTLFDYYDNYLAFLRVLSASNPAQWKLLEEVHGSPIDVHSLSMMDITPPEHVPGKIPTASLELAGYSFELNLEPIRKYSRTFTNPADGYAGSLYIYLGEGPKRQYCLNIGFEYSPTEGFHLVYSDDEVARWKRIWAALFGPLRRNTVAVLRGHRRYLANAAEYDRLEQLLKLKVKL